MQIPQASHRARVDSPQLEVRSHQSSAQFQIQRLKLGANLGQARRHAEVLALEQVVARLPHQFTIVLMPNRTMHLRARTDRFKSEIDDREWLADRESSTTDPTVDLVSRCSSARSPSLRPRWASISRISIKLVRQSSCSQARSIPSCEPSHRACECPSWSSNCGSVTDMLEVADRYADI